MIGRMGFICLIFLVVACSGQPAKISNEPRLPSNTFLTPESQFAWAGHSKAAEWNEAARRSLLSENSELLAINPTDVVAACAHFVEFNQDERISFWTGYAAEIARIQKKYFNGNSESEIENFFGEDQIQSLNNDRAPQLVNVGLLNLSIQTPKQYNCSSFDTKSGTSIMSQLKDGSKNLSCALTVIKTLVVKSNCLKCQVGDVYKGAAAYFGPARGYVRIGNNLTSVEPTLTALKQNPLCQ